MNPLDSTDTAAYASREALTSTLGNFAGGDAGGALIFIILVAGIAALVVLLLDRR